MNDVRDIAGLVDTDAGVVSRELFVNRELYEMELDRIFTRAWLLIGHEGLVPAPETFFVTRMGDDSVLLTRNRQGEILAFLNSCPHRGMRVCRYDQGSASVFSCPYHGWTFSTNRDQVERPGQLVGVPHAEDYPAGLDRARWGLTPVPRLVNYKGSIWASWDPDAPPLEDYLGDMRRYLDVALDHRDGSPGGSELLGGVQKWRIKCNWKTVAENFAGDLYHEVSHQSANLAEIGLAKGKGRRDKLPPRHAIGFDGLGHGGLGFPPSDEPPLNLSPDYGDAEINAYFQELHAAKLRNTAGKSHVNIVVGTIFPNMSFHANQPRSLAIIHPIGPTEVEMWRMYLVDADTPPKVRDMLRRYYLRYSGPGGMTERDDMENWTSVTQTSQGAMARRQAFNYQLGLGKETPVPGLRQGVDSGSYSEGNARIYYRRWAEFMAATGWSEIGAARAAGRAAAHAG